ncbi:hypothetical protein GCM10009665_38600 [Kitasatospora nipponensis]|uniref:Uncharacterized protein n=1 Tax=Kitasatospora nipponensis TaxID=258049 RepID=A0ABP4GZ83_9ACTN
MWVGHPVALVAAVVLLLNDRVLKGAWPGRVTGKLSDLAGLVIAPALLALLASLVLPVAADRLAAGAVIVTGAGFALVSPTGTGAHLASRLWTLAAGPSQVLADPGDLLALPALLLAWWLWTRVRHRSGPAGAARRLRVLVAVPLAVLATVATSRSGSPPAVWEVGRADGHLELWTAAEQRQAAWVSADGGVSWQPGDRPAPAPAPAPPPPTGAPSAGPPPSGPASSDRDCVPAEPAHCYRVGEGLQSVQESRDGGAHWSSAWQLSPGRAKYLRRAEGWVAALALVAGDEPVLTPTTLAVAPVPGGYRVIVADREDGLLLRDRDGRWQRRGFADLGGPGPVPTTGLGRHMAGEYLVAGTAGWPAMLAGLTLHRLRRTVPARRAEARARAGARFAAATALLLVTTWWTGTHGDPGPTAYAWGVFSVLLLIPLSLPQPDPAQDAWRPPPLAPLTRLLLGTVAGATALLTALPYLAWTTGQLDSYDLAGALAVGAAATGLPAAALVGLRTPSRWTRADPGPRQRTATNGR